MDLFYKLEKKQRPTPFGKSQEMAFYLDNRVLLSNVSGYAPFLKAEDSFNIVRANILIRAIMNKEIIEKAYALKLKEEKKEGLATTSVKDYMDQAMAELPFLKWKQDQRIYVPIFPANLNVVYAGQFQKLMVPPYLSLLKDYDGVTIDPFDYYGPALFNSYFTKLVEVRSNPSGSAFYDFDAEAVYFVNLQGRLDAKLCLFDRSLHHPSHNHMLKRLFPVVDAYYANDRETMIKALVDNKLISSKEIYKIKSDESKFLASLNRKGA
jgi:hypothetical protein